jgi:endothelin-converting enzyme/putative endopeptidase
MRPVRIATSLFLVCAAALAEPAAQRGIELTDMNRNVEACTDFFEFANGAWRAANPIPPSMSRWSRRWEAGESAKEQLEGILEETAAVKGTAKGSVDQLIGDFYGACMNVDEINRLGVKPLDAALLNGAKEIKPRWNPLLNEIVARSGSRSTDRRRLTRDPFPVRCAVPYAGS